jgi:hypothetical protein
LFRQLRAPAKQSNWNRQVRLLRAIAPLRKRLAFVAGNDVAVISVGTNISIGINGDAS